MESALYPLKFMPLYKNKIWGGNKIKELGFDYDPLPNCGELWVLSGVEYNESIVTNGFLAENNLSEVLEIYMGELIGERNYEWFGNDFPILIKLIDSADDLSIQVHPDDKLAQSRGMDNGKTEMWYIVDAEEGATIVNGFTKDTTPIEYTDALQKGKLEELLHKEEVQKGDTFFIPAGRVHALGKGILTAEIQQSSDCTYRIYDYNRPGEDGRLRELHTQEAMDAIQFEKVTDGRTHYLYSENKTVSLADTPYFTTNLIALTKPIRKDFHNLDSFVVYFCVEGIAAVKCMDEICPIHAGECVLIPAVADIVELFSEGPAKLLEVYIDPERHTEKGNVRMMETDWISSFIGACDTDSEGNEDCGCHEHHDHHDHDCGCHEHHDHDCGCHEHHEHDCGCHHKD